MKKIITLSFILLLTLTACSAKNEEAAYGGGGMGMGHEATRNFHHAEIPEPYADATNPVEADAESIARGGEIYKINCAECHGDGGMGDGPSGVALNPSPAVLAHTSRMMGDSYLFWRINEGGAEAGTGMLSFKNRLEEDEIWDVINYVRALGSGDVEPVDSGMGGAAYDPEYERTRHESMLNAGIDAELIDQTQADNFMLVHDALDVYMEENDIRPSAQSVDEMQPEIFAKLIEAGTLTQEQVDSFNKVHQLLLDEGLMQ